MIVELRLILTYNNFYFEFLFSSLTNSPEKQYVSFIFNFVLLLASSTRQPMEGWKLGEVSTHIFKFFLFFSQGQKYKFKGFATPMEKHTLL
jgi:hypothetical protein